MERLGRSVPFDNRLVALGRHDHVFKRHRGIHTDPFPYLFLRSLACTVAGEGTDCIHAYRRVPERHIHLLARHRLSDLSIHVVKADDPFGLARNRSAAEGCLRHCETYLYV